MAFVNFIGGTTAVAQVATCTISGDWDAPDTITTTLTAEDGSTTESVQSTATGTTEETDVIDVHVTALNASAQSLFTKITWAKATASTFTATADTAGVPLSGTLDTLPDKTVSTAGTGDAAWASTTANAGPNDFNTLANFTKEDDTAAAALPATSDDVKILPHPSDVDVAGNPVSYDILYGLNQSDIDVNTFRVAVSYTGTIGDAVNSYDLNIPCTANGGTGITVLTSSCPTLRIAGNHTQITVNSTRNTSQALTLGTGTVTTLRILGADVQGTITINAIVTTAEIEDVGGANIKFNTSGTAITTLETNAPRLEVQRAIGTLSAFGGDITHTSGALTTIYNRGATIHYNGSGNNVTFEQRSGFFDLTQNRHHNVSIGTTLATMWGGLVSDRSGLKNVTWGPAGAGLIVHGGTAQVESGATQVQN